MENEILNKIININKKIEEFAASHSDDDALIDEIKNLCNDNNFKSEKYIKEYFKDKVNLDRTLRVGIVGRVKSGKSSLLNSLLFDGKDILPKAATPMTAALTNIQYSDTNYIEIEFLTKKDIEDLEEIYNSYNNALKKAIEDLQGQNSTQKITSAVGTKVSAGINKLKSKFTREENINFFEENNENIKEYYDYDKFEKDAKEIVDKNEYLKNGKEKYDLIKKANKSVYNHVLKQEKEKIDFKNIEEISDKLKDYVGTEGKFVDFVKSLNIYINIDYLKDLNILDTPGFNDPVGTRDAKARELLSKCDVVLISMSATQLFTESDRDIISKIRKKEGIQEIYVIISKFDDVLNSQENIKKSNGDLEEAKNIILNGVEGDKGLIEHIKNIFIKMNDENIFNKLISEIDKRVIYSSSICHSILKNWDNYEKLDEDSKKVIENLSEGYPDYISLKERETSLEQLKQLANIDAINNILKNLTVRKNEILGESLNKFETKFTESAKDIQRKLDKYARERLKYIKFGNINNIKIESEKLEKSINKISESLKGKFEDTIEEWYIESLNKINDSLNKFFNKAKDSADEAKSEETRTKKEGWFIFEKNVTYKENIINTEKIRELIREYARNFNRQLEIFILNIYKLFREDLIRNTTNLFQNEELDINREQVASIIRPIIMEYENNINKYDENLHLDSIKETGTISGYLVDEVVKKANDIIRQMDKDFDKIVREDNLKEFKDKISEIDFADTVLSNYRNRLNKYKEEIENKEKAIDKWNRIKKEIDNLV
jgi:predicted GTPase